MPAIDLPKCAACESEIKPLPEKYANDNVVSIGGITGKIDMGTPLMGQICESCHRIVCVTCWVKETTTPEKFDVCSQCGGHLTNLSTKNIP
jgi:hypothetical protein